MNYGDINTKFFHSALKARRSANRIFTFKDLNGNTKTDIDGISTAFIEYYSKFLGTANEHREHVCSSTMKQVAYAIRESLEILK